MAHNLEFNLVSYLGAKITLIAIRHKEKGKYFRFMSNISLLNVTF